MTPGSGPAVSYGFDASGNLTTLPTGAAGSYDHAGELTSSTLSGTTTSYTYNADGERLTAQQGSHHYRRRHLERRRPAHRLQQRRRRT